MSSVYARLGAHRSMVFDAVRNAAYARAIRAAVQPDSVVLDLGAGLGLHGLMAAAAGARRVYLVEPQAVVQLAGEIARTNGLDDRITILQGRLEDFEPPEPVDVIVSVFTGNLLFSEDLLPTLFVARDRWLRPGGRLLPEEAELHAVPVHAPAWHHEHIGRWSEPLQDLDFSAPRRFVRHELMWPPRDQAASMVRLSRPACMATVDLRTALHADCIGRAEADVDTVGECHGLLAWIRIRLGGEWLSTDPQEPEVHWSCAFLPLDPPLALRQGEKIAISLQRPAWGEWTWSVEAGDGTRRHCTALSDAAGATRFKRIAPASRVGLAAGGERALHILAEMRRGSANAEIAQQTAERFGLGHEEALREVQAIALQFGA